MEFWVCCDEGWGMVVARVLWVVGGGIGDVDVVLGKVSLGN